MVCEEVLWIWGYKKQLAHNNIFTFFFNNTHRALTPCGFLNRWKNRQSFVIFFFVLFWTQYISTSSDSLVMVELRVCDVKEFPFGWRCPSVPGTRVIAPLDASKVLSLLSVNCPLDHPVQPQALRRPADGARDGCAASNLKTRYKS